MLLATRAWGLWRGAATIVHRRPRTMRRVFTALNRRHEARASTLWLFWTAISTTNTLVWRIHGTPELMWAFRAASTIARATIWLEARFRTTRAVELPALTRTAELHRLLTAF